MLLGILHDAIIEEPLYSDRNKALASLKRILSIAPIKDRARIQKEKSGYKDLLLRQKLDEINKIFERCNMKQKDGIADLSAFKDLDQQEQNAIQMTLSKAYMMHMLKNEDWKKLTQLNNSILFSGYGVKFDTYAQRRLTQIFDELTEILKGIDQEATSIHNKILHCLNSGDLEYLQNHKENLHQVNAKSLSESIDDLKIQLSDILDRPDYLSYFALYRDRPLLQAQHNAILRNAQILTKGDTEGLVDLFTELSQLKVSLNSLGNARDRGMTGLTQGYDTFINAGAIDWMGVPGRVSDIKDTIAILQSQILQELEALKVISVDKLAIQMLQKYKEKAVTIKRELQKKEIWVLAMDGGGVRGKIAAEILRDLIHQLKKKGQNKGLSDTFDIVAGTSVGGLIALALNMEDEKGRPAMDEDYIATLLETEKASIIFPPKSGVNKTASQGNSNAYDPFPLESLLLANFGYKPLSDMRKSTTVMAHSTITERAVAFNSCLASTIEMTTAGCAQSTTAAPTYFPPNVQCYDERVQEYVDGGMTENNPVYEALLDFKYLMESDRDWGSTKINVLSIGTGSIEHNIPHGRAKTGVKGVAHTVLNGMMPKSIEDAHEKAVLSLGGFMQSGAVVSYYRLNPVLDVPIELDSASEENLAKLRTLTYESILSSPFYAQLVEHLTGERIPVESQYVEIRGKTTDRREEFTKIPPYLNSMERKRK